MSRRPRRNRTPAFKAKARELAPSSTSTRGGLGVFSVLSIRAVAMAAPKTRPVPRPVSVPRAGGWSSARGR